LYKGIIFHTQKLKGSHGYVPANWHFSFLAGPADHAPLHGDWALGTGQDVGAHTGAGGECTDATEAGIGADRLAQPPLPHTRLLCMASHGNPDLLDTFLVF